MIVKSPFVDEEVRVILNRKVGKFELTTEVELPASLDEVFAFFADAKNLAVLTPDWLNFKILSDLPIEMKKGARIDYQLNWHGLPMKWQSEIAEWRPNERFVDRQLKGPYHSWWHEHLFFDLAGEATLMRDRVLYSVPGGRMIHKLIVKKDVKKIFEYRRAKILELFAN